MDHPKKTLDRYGVEPKKSLGQNFITNESILLSITAAADLINTDDVLEVGPGIGDLTRLIAKQTQQVVAVEIDGRLITILQNRLVELENVKIIQADILQLEPATFFSRPYKIVANLPYYITGAFLRHIYSFELKPSLMVLTIQEEVARRITSDPGKMSLLAVTVQYYADVQLIRSISSGSFWPKPNVDSAVVSFKLKERLPYKWKEEEQLFKLVRVGFSQKRKQLKNNLRQLGLSKDKLGQAMKDAGIDGTRRAQSLSVEEWVGLRDQLN
jgi:16S rRNA (adenine1518-N6/adenine1519-N6)-dimethyltransferase